MLHKDLLTCSFWHIKMPVFIVTCVTCMYLYVCLCTCVICVYLYVCLCTCVTCVYLYVCLCTCVACVYLYVCVCVPVCVPVCVFVYLCVSVCVCMCVYVPVCSLATVSSCLCCSVGRKITTVLSTMPTRHAVSSIRWVLTPVLTLIILIIAAATALARDLFPGFSVEPWLCIETTSHDRIIVLAVQIWRCLYFCYFTELRKCLCFTAVTVFQIFSAS